MRARKLVIILTYQILLLSFGLEVSLVSALSSSASASTVQDSSDPNRNGSSVSEAEFLEAEQNAQFMSGDNEADSDADAEVQIEVADVESSDTFTGQRSSPVLTISVEAPGTKSSNVNGSATENTAVANVYEDTIDANQIGGNNTTNTTTTKPPVNITVTCIQRDLPIYENGSFIQPVVEIVNTTILHGDVLWINTTIKTRSTPSNCSIVLFYAHWCPFSAKAAPHFNALARAFPQLRVAAIDSTIHSSVNSFFGILSVPTILLFHNGKTVAKFNDTLLTLNKFAEFIHVFTDLRSDDKINVTSQDFRGPLPSVPSETQDIWLYTAWIFIIVCFVHYASKSTLWRKVSDLVRTTWREAEAQHEHTD